MLNVCDFIVNPFVQPTHFELSDTVKKILQYFESPCSQTYVSKPYLIDFSSYLQRFVHHKACDRYPKKQRKTEFVEQVNENDNNVEALENKAKIAVVIIV
jgi:hypothetical protein